MGFGASTCLLRTQYRILVDHSVEYPAHPEALDNMFLSVFILAFSLHFRVVITVPCSPIAAHGDAACTGNTLI